MKTGIVILNYNSYELTCNLTRKCLTIGEIDKIVIIDNNSNDDFDEFCQTLNQGKIKYFKNSLNSGYAAGNNIGLKYLEENGYDIAFIANPDTMFEAKTIENISNFLEKNPEYAVASCQRTLHGSRQTGQFWWIPPFYEVLIESVVLLGKIRSKRVIAKTCEEIEKNPNSYLTVEVVGGAFFGCNLKVMKKIGFLDEGTFLWYEENILAYKLREKGYKEALLTNCDYEHNHAGKKNRGTKKIKILLDSKRHYAYKYLKINVFQKIVLKIFDFIGILENRLLCLIKK